MNTIEISWSTDEGARVSIRRDRKASKPPQAGQPPRPDITGWDLTIEAYRLADTVDVLLGSADHTLITEVSLPDINHVNPLPLQVMFTVDRSSQDQELNLSWPEAGGGRVSVSASGPCAEYSSLLSKVAQAATSALSEDTYTKLSGSYEEASRDGTLRRLANETEEWDIDGMTIDAPRGMGTVLIELRQWEAHP